MEIKYIINTKKKLQLICLPLAREKFNIVKRKNNLGFQKAMFFL